VAERAGLNPGGKGREEASYDKKSKKKKMRGGEEKRGRRIDSSRVSIRMNHGNGVEGAMR
jgi:hypothetical protein